jgi:hypothetical protein
VWVPPAWTVAAHHDPVVVRKVIDMDLREPTMTVADLDAVTARTLVMASDDHTIVLDHPPAAVLSARASEPRLATVARTCRVADRRRP